MAELVNGTYAIISVSSSLALDAHSNGVDAITFQELEFDDSQSWSVCRVGSVYLSDADQRNTWALKAIINGKVATPADYENTSGLDVVQSNYITDDYSYGDDPTEEEQEEDVLYDPTYDTQWVIDDYGSTGTYDGDTYRIYTIRRVTVPYSDEEVSYGTLNVALSYSANGPITQTYSGGTEQQWMFVPVSLLSENGLYTIRSAVDPTIGLMVSSKSAANGASIVLGAINDETHQQFKTINYNGYYRFSPRHQSEKAIDIKGNAFKNGVDLVQYTINQVDNVVSKNVTLASGVYANLTISVSFSTTQCTVNVSRMNYWTTAKKGLGQKTTAKVEFTSVSVNPASKPAVKTNQTKSYAKGGAKGSGNGFGLTKFKFVFNRTSSNFAPKINMTVSETYQTSKKKTVTHSKVITLAPTVWAISQTDIDVTDQTQIWNVIPKSHVEFDGTVYQTYEIAAKSSGSFVFDIVGGNVKANTNVQIYTRNNSNGQRFIFIKSVCDSTELDEPGEIRELAFSRSGSGDVVVSNLTFQSMYDAFMARYKVRTYTSETAYTDSNWMNVSDDSTPRSGWGEAGKPTFEYTPIGNIVRIPFTRTYSLGDGVYAIDLIFEIRAFVEEYGTEGLTVQGPVRQSQIKVRQNPTVSMRSSTIYSDAYTNEVGILTTISDSLGEGCQIVRGRLLDSSGVPISEWISDSSMQLLHSSKSGLYRLPYNGESIQFEYSMLSKNGTYISGKINKSFSYSSGSSPTLTYLDDDSCTAIVTIPSATYAFCLLSVPDIDVNRLVIAEQVNVTDGIGWRIAPPLNQDFDVYVLTSEDNTNWSYASTSGYISSHLFIWNWTSDGSTDALDEYTSVIVNTDNPPQQSRSYTTGVQYSKPMSRRYPVGFSDISVDTILNVEGVAIDSDANYVAAGPLPQHSSVENFRNLVSLSGKGIHPIYRTPYGDWYTVAIEQVDLGKIEVGKCQVKVAQKAVKDE